MEKLFLAITITFSLNVFLQVRLPDRVPGEGNIFQQPDDAPQILVKLPRQSQLQLQQISVWHRFRIKS